MKKIISLALLSLVMLVPSAFSGGNNTKFQAVPTYESEYGEVEFTSNPSPGAAEYTRTNYAKGIAINDAMQRTMLRFSNAMSGWAVTMDDSANTVSNGKFWHIICCERSRHFYSSI